MYVVDLRVRTFPPTLQQQHFYGRLYRFTLTKVQKPLEGTIFAVLCTKLSSKHAYGLV